MFRSASCVMFVALLVMGCASTQGGSGADSSLAVIKPAGIFEDCVEAGPGQVIEYSFHSSGLLEFNIHFHEEGEVHYPVSVGPVSNHSGSMAPEAKRHYCLMWSNGAVEKVRLRYAFGVKVGRTGAPEK